MDINLTTLLRLTNALVGFLHYPITPSSSAVCQAHSLSKYQANGSNKAKREKKSVKLSIYKFSLNFCPIHIPNPMKYVSDPSRSARLIFSFHYPHSDVSKTVHWPNKEPIGHK